MASAWSSFPNTGSSTICAAGTAAVWAARRRSRRSNTASISSTRRRSAGGRAESTPWFMPSSADGPTWPTPSSAWCNIANSSRTSSGFRPATRSPNSCSSATTLPKNAPRRNEPGSGQAMMRTPSIALAAASALGMVLAVGAPAPTAAQSDAERLYQDLSRLPPAERQAKLEEGARREGKLAFVHSLRGQVGRAHVAAFQARYPFIAVDHTDTGSQEASERFIEEERAGRHLTDALSLAIPDLDQILALDLLAPNPTRATAGIKLRFKAFIDPQGRW